MGGVMGTEALKKKMKEFCEGNEDLYQQAEAIFDYGEKKHQLANLDKIIKKQSICQHIFEHVHNLIQTRSPSPTIRTAGARPRLSLILSRNQPIRPRSQRSAAG